MHRGSAALGGALVVGLVLVPASAIGRPVADRSRARTPVAAVASAPAPPRAGLWRIASGGPNDDNLAGAFTINRGHTVSRLSGRIQSQAPAACGTGTVTVDGSMRIFDATGMTPQGHRYSEWVVGRNVPSADPVIQPQRVQLTVAGRRVAGSLAIVFASIREESGGDIYYDGGNCDLNFLVGRR
jgi:hypothetical protein